MIDIADMQSRFPRVLRQTVTLLANVDAAPVLAELVEQIPHEIPVTQEEIQEINAAGLPTQLAALFFVHGAASTLLLLSERLSIDIRTPMRILLQPGRGSR